MNFVSDRLTGIVADVFDAILDIIDRLFNFIFGDINFAVLWNWLPSDIQAAAAFLVTLLFGFVIIRAIKAVLPFI